MSNSRVKYVDHTYRDFSRYTQDGGQLVKHKKSETNFPAKLHQMVSDPRHSRIITWMPHGRAFKIIDKDVLFTSVIPQYYVCNKYDSFTRQLNAWGFKRLYQSGPDLGCHYHECFLRGLPKFTCLIRRLPPSQGKATPYPAGEPNLYTISAAFPLPPTVSSNLSTRSPGGNPVADEAAATTSTLDQTRHDQTQSENAYPTSSLIQTSAGGHPSGLPSSSSVSTSTQLKEPPNQDSATVLAASASGYAPSSRRQSTEVQHSSSFPIRPLPHEYPLARMAYEAPHQMPQHYARGYQYPQFQGQTSHPRSNPTNYMPTLGYSGQYYGSSHGQHPTQGQNPQYLHQPSRRSRFRYPPPQLTHQLTPGNVAPTEGHLPQGSYQRYRGSDLDTGQLLPQATTQQGSQGLDTTSPEQSWRDTNDGSLAIEPLPYSPRSRSRKESEALESGSPVHKKPKPEPPP